MVTIETTTDTLREKSLMDYRKKLLEHKEVESRLKESKFWGYVYIKWRVIFVLITKKTLFFKLISVREQNKELTKNFDKSENDLKALQSVGQIVGEVLKQLTEDKCKWFPIQSKFIN